MKKFIGFLSIAVVAATLHFSCRPTVKKEVIIVKEPRQKATTVTVEKNGVKVETRKVEVSVKDQ